MPEGVCNFTWVVDTGVNPNVTQEDSINANLSLVTDQCVPIFSDATCGANLTTSLLVEPPIPPPTATTTQVVVIAIIFVLYTGIPLVTLIYVLARRQKQAEHSSRSHSSEADDELSTRLKRGSSRALTVDKQYVISFQSLSYSVKLNKESRKKLLKENPEIRETKGWDVKRILKDLTGSFEPKSLSAIMGPSGCGKSTLLDVLADRKHEGYTRGDVLVNGQPRDRQFKTYAAYVMQSDALFPYLTVREVLSYSAELRLPGSDWVKRDALVQAVIDDLDLTGVADTRIGDPASSSASSVRGISGGQARRVTVGLELITEPSVLFLDEPTTGLDAYSSLTLVKTLRKLADSGRTLLCTIHQPRPDIFRLFDKLLLMKAGEIAYFGPVTDMKDYFAHIGLTIPEDVNPADFVVDLTYSKEASDKAESENTVDRLVNEYTKSALASANLDRLKELGSRFSRATTGTSSTATSSLYLQSIPTQMYILLRRSYKNISRNRGFFVTVLLQSLQFLFYGLLFFNLEGNLANDGFGYSFADTPGAKAANFPDTKSFRMLTFTRAFLFQTMNTVALIETVVIASAFLEKRIFMREHAAGAYSSFAYHLQWGVRFSVDAIWKAMLATILSYFLPQFTNLSAERVFFFFATLVVTSSIGSSLAFMMVSLVPDAEGAANIHNTIIGFMGLYSGFFLPPFLIPVFFIWAYFLSFLKYGFEALELNQFENCQKNEVLLFLQVDPTLNKWTNLLVYMAYPVIFHGIALLGTFLRTRSRSYWTEACPCCCRQEDEEDFMESIEKEKESAKGDGDLREIELQIKEQQAVAKV